MFNFFKKLFSNDDYDNRFKAALEKFADSDNIYDVKLALIMAKSRNNNVDWGEVEEWWNATGFEKEQMKDSLSRFTTELYS